MKVKDDCAYKLPKRKQPVFKCAKPFLKLIYKKPKIVYLDQPIPEKCIIISNHCSKKGPMVLELYLPAFCAKWGAHEMLGNYKSRLHYLRDVYYIQKKGYGKFRASITASFQSLFSIFFYRGMKILPTYTDARFVKTISYSMEVLNNDMSIMVFPENSSEGYKEVLTEFLPGFVMLAQRYFKKFEIDVPICPIYYNDKKNVIYVDKLYSVQDFVQQGLDNKQIAEQFCGIVNNLYYKTLEYVKK